MSTKLVRSGTYNKGERLSIKFSFRPLTIKITILRWNSVNRRIFYILVQIENILSNGDDRSFLYQIR